MSEQITIPVAGHAELHLSTRSGSVRVTAEERADVLIESGAPPRERIETDATGRISVMSARGGSASLEVRCPAGTDVVVGMISGSAELRGQFGAVRVNTVSGSIEIDRVEEIDARTISGNIDVSACSGKCRLATKSGRTSCGGAGDARVSTLSGSVELAAVTGSAKVQSVSGSVELGLRGKGDVAVQTMSGSVRVQVPSGVRPATRLRSMSGRPKSECEEGDDCEIRVQSLSGRIEVVPF